MPRLPSGRDVGIASDPILRFAREGHLLLTLGFLYLVESIDDLAPLIDITYYHAEAGQDGPGTPYLSDLKVADVGSDKCDWPDEDVAYFRHWLESQVAQQWLQEVYDELSLLIRTVKVTAPLPEALQGILDDDD